MITKCSRFIARMPSGSMRCGELSCSISDHESVDARRREVGMPPLAEELRAQRQAARAEGAAPPADYEAYRRMSEEWARSVGWR